MQSEMHAIYAKLEIVLKTLHHGEYINYDIRREFLMLEAYLKDQSRGIEDVQGALEYATDVMEEVVQEFHNLKHPRFIQADALRRMSEGILALCEDPQNEEGWWERQQALSASYAQESHDLIVGLYVK